MFVVEYEGKPIEQRFATTKRAFEEGGMFCQALPMERDEAESLVEEQGYGRLRELTLEVGLR